MRFTAAALIFAGAALANGHGSDTKVDTDVISTVTPFSPGSTVYATTVKTITQCPEEVDDCPADKATYIEVTETVAPTQTYVSVQPTLSKHYNGTSSYPEKEPSCPGVSVKTISTYTTTVIPTVIYETVQIPCSTSEVKPTVKPTVIPTGGYASPSTGPSTTAPVFVGAASNVGVSIFAVAAGLVALLA